MWEAEKTNCREFHQIGDSMKTKSLISDKPQNKDILRFFHHNPRVGLTVSEAQSLGLGTELRKRLCELKGDGYQFFDIWEPNKFSGRHKRYYMKIKSVAA